MYPEFHLLYCPHFKPEGWRRRSWMQRERSATFVMRCVCVCVCVCVVRISKSEKTLGERSTHVLQDARGGTGGHHSHRNGRLFQSHPNKDRVKRQRPRPLLRIVTHARKRWTQSGSSISRALVVQPGFRSHSKRSKNAHGVSSCGRLLHQTTLDASTVT